MELLVSLALIPSMCLCLGCLWCQMRSHGKSARKVGDAGSQRVKGRRFRDDELPGSNHWGGVRGNLDSIGEGQQSASWRDTAARARKQAHECSWRSTAARAREEARGRTQQSSWRDTAARAKEHARCEGNRLPPLQPAASSADPFARRKLPSIRGAALANAALQTLRGGPQTLGAPQPHRPSPMPPGWSGSTSAVQNIQQNIVINQQSIVAPRAMRAAPAPPISSPPPRRSLTTSFDEERRVPLGPGERKPKPEPKPLKHSSGHIQDRMPKTGLVRWRLKAPLSQR